MKKWIKEHKRPVLIGVAVLITIILIIVGIIIFHDKHHSYAYSPNIADNIYNFINEWASAFAPALTFLGIAAALYMSFRSLNQTKEIREKDRKERLLKEIIEWAEEATVVIDEFKRGVIGTSPYHHRQLMMAKKANIVGISMGFHLELGEKLKKALNDFDTFYNENNHTTQSFKSAAESCRKSMLELIESIGVIRGKL